MASPIEARMIVDALPPPLLVLASDQVVLAANACGITTFTQGTADPVGKNFKDVAAEIWWVSLGEAVNYVTREGRARTVSAMIPAPEATADPCDAVVQPIRRADGMLAGVVITIENARDSDRRLSAQLHTANAELQTANEELEARLEELRRAYRMDEERNRFLAMLAHELRNPLAAITNALSLLPRRRIAGGRDGETDAHGYRQRHRAGAARARLRPVHAGRRGPCSRGGRSRHRPHSGAASGRAPRWDDRSAQRGPWPRQHVRGEPAAR